MPRQVLPGYAWDERMAGGGRYRLLLAGGRYGRLVSRATVIEGLHDLCDRSEAALAGLIESLLAGELTVQDAQLAGQVLLKDLYNACAALGRGGIQRLDAAAWGRTGRILGRGTADYPVGEYASWRAFVEEAATGDLTAAQIRARAALYVGKAYSRFWQEDRLLKLADQRIARERWDDRHDARECDDCRALAALGWVPAGSLGTVPGAGATRCLGNCRCVLVYE